MQTGTGPGRIIATAQISFYSGSDGYVNACAVQWSGEDWLLPLVPGIAFDQDFPNTRRLEFDETVLIGTDAQAHQLDEFEYWVACASTAFRESGFIPTFGTLQLVTRPERAAAAQVAFTIRLNDRHGRLWGESAHRPKNSRDSLAFIVDDVLWDWAATRDGASERATAMFSLLASQLDYYRDHGIPSDFRMREIGRAPYAAWRAAGRSDSPTGPLT